jgi:hypothetical protein
MGKRWLLMTKLEAHLRVVLRHAFWKETCPQAGFKGTVRTFRTGIGFFLSVDRL